MIYEDHILKMQDFHGFYAKWTSLIGYYKTHEEAYDAVERIYFTHFKRTRYKNFETFKSTVTKQLKPESPVTVRPAKKVVKKRRKKLK